VRRPKPWCTAMYWIAKRIVARTYLHVSIDGVEMRWGEHTVPLNTAQSSARRLYLLDQNLAHSSNMHRASNVPPRPRRRGACVSLTSGSRSCLFAIAIPIASWSKSNHSLSCPDFARLASPHLNALLANCICYPRAMRSCALTRCVHRVGDLANPCLTDRHTLTHSDWVVEGMSCILIGWVVHAFQILRCQKCQACFGRKG